MSDIKKEKEFIDGLLSEGAIKDVSEDSIYQENIKFKEKFEKITPPSAVTVNENSAIKEGGIFEAPEDELEAPVVDPIAAVEAEPEVGDEPLDAPMDDPAPVEEPVGDESDPVTSAVMALFLTSIVRAGANFKEYKSEAMKEALAKQGVDDAMYNAIGKALYELDTKSEMFN